MGQKGVDFVAKTVEKVRFLPKQPKALRVAAYARVSSGKDAMLNSLSAQISYYNEYIQNHPGWLYCGVYSDAAKTGTKENRDGFQRLLEACRAGEVDLVLTKSISRFARNTVTLLSMVRELTALGVDIYFERENLHSTGSDGELMLAILASFAQEESRSASENQLWRVRKNFEEGIPWHGIMLGYRMENGRYEIVPEEAELVRRIFNDYLSGMGYQAIAKQLNEEGIPSSWGSKWIDSAVQKLLCNYAYTGNLLLQKTFRENHLTKRQVLNRGEQPMYHAEHTHEAIISMETFMAVQEEKARRTEKYSKKEYAKTVYPFTHLLRCANCGRYYRRKTTATGPVWICSTFNTKGKSACPSKQIPEGTLIAVTAELLGVEQFTEELLRRVVDHVEVYNGNALVFHRKDGTQATHTWKDRSRSESWTPERREAAKQKRLQQKEN